MNIWINLHHVLHCVFWWSFKLTGEKCCTSFLYQPHTHTHTDRVTWRWMTWSAANARIESEIKCKKKRLLCIRCFRRKCLAYSHMRIIITMSNSDRVTRRRRQQHSSAWVENISQLTEGKSLPLEVALSRSKKSSFTNTLCMMNRWRGKKRQQEEGERERERRENTYKLNVWICLFFSSTPSSIFFQSFVRQLIRANSLAASLDRIRRKRLAKMSRDATQLALLKPIVHITRWMRIATHSRHRCISSHTSSSSG